MWLEHCRNLAVAIQFANALRTLVYLLRMMGIVAEEHQFVALYLEVETTVNSSVGLHSIFQFLGSTTIQLCHSHSCNTIVDIDGHWLTEFHILHILYW